MKSSLIFPDVNALVALTIAPHPHYSVAQTWLDAIDTRQLVLCRQTQMGYLRLLTTRSAMSNETLTNEEAWRFLDRLGRSIALRYASEPASLEAVFRGRSNLRSASPKRWMDAYLSVLASELGLQVVTFDSALALYTPRSILLRP
jgi:toxin-antitoxin system PIN domain toxin